MASHVIAADSACDEEEKSGDGRGSQESCFDQKQRDARQLIIPPSVSVESCSDEKQQDVRQPMSPPSVSALCSTCAQPQSESDWNFSIEDGVPIKNKNNSSTSIKRADLMKDKDKAGKGQKMRRNKGRVSYRRPPHVLFSP